MEDRHQMIAEAPYDCWLFNLSVWMPVNCGYEHCRQIIKRVHRTGTYIWDGIVMGTLGKKQQVPQPLWQWLDSKTVEALRGGISGKLPDRSVIALCWHVTPAFEGFGR